jgi:hypothetical protein
MYISILMNQIDNIQTEQETCIQVDTSLPHIMLDMLRITTLVYEYGNKIVVDDNNMNIEEFVSKMKDSGELDKIDINDNLKNMMVEISNCVPTGKIYKFISDPDTDVQVCITTCDCKKRVCIVFRGSESKTDWYYDLLITKYNLTDEIRVHKGFHTQLNSNKIYDELLTDIQIILKQNPDYEIYVTGHSAGAALSTLFGYLLSHIIENLVTIVSFASPRVGNYAWKKSFENTLNLRHYRITNKRDIITAFPLYRYYHVGKNIELSDNTFILFENSDNKKWYEETILTCWSIAEHSCELYYKRCNINNIR